ncbi:choline kinase [Alphaproteobacteria bacterium 46_93_T64]|nr:choline kinase [Alphaproteobacteria bacterium 46_93_T64]
MSKLLSKVVDLKCWRGKVSAVPLEGGITNQNFVVEDCGEKFVVRLGHDIPLHHVMRFNELAAGQAAFEAGLSPEIYYNEPGIMVIRFINGKTLTSTDIRHPKTLERLVPVINACHREIPNYLHGPVLSFWVFHVLRDYAATIRQGQGRRSSNLLQLIQHAGILETAVGAIDVVFGHNDLLASNFIDDGDKIWLFDWDYAGFNSPLFDLGGLSSNNDLSDAQQKWLLETYFETPLTDELWHRYSAMKCASLLRETMWSMVSEIHSDIDFDYQSYTDTNLAGFMASFQDFTNL